MSLNHTVALCVLYNVDRNVQQKQQSFNFMYNVIFLSLAWHKRNQVIQKHTENKNIRYYPGS